MRNSMGLFVQLSPVAHQFYHQVISTVLDATTKRKRSFPGLNHLPGEGSGPQQIYIGSGASVNNRSGVIPLFKVRVSVRRHPQSDGPFLLLQSGTKTGESNTSRVRIKAKANTHTKSYTKAYTHTTTQAHTSTSSEESDITSTKGNIPTPKACSLENEGSRVVYRGNQTTCRDSGGIVL
jgi:hypothetical protein